MYDRMTYAESVGEAEWQREGYEPSHVFLGSDLAEMDHDDLEVVRHITQRDRHRTLERLERENASLRALVDELTR